MEHDGGDDEFGAMLARAKSAQTPRQRHRVLVSNHLVAHGKANASIRASMAQLAADCQMFTGRHPDEMTALAESEPEPRPEPGRLARAFSTPPTGPELVSSVRAARGAGDGLNLTDRIIGRMTRLRSSAVPVSEATDRRLSEDSDGDPGTLTQTLVAAPGAPSFSVITTA